MAIDLTSMTLTVTDDLNGSSASAVATGQGNGSLVTLYRSPWNPQAGGRMQWTLVSGLVGTFGGSAVFPNVVTPPGFYVWQACRMYDPNAADMLSQAVFRPVVDPAAPIHGQILDAVVTLIRSLNLDGIGGDPAKVFKRWLPIYLHDNDAVSGGGAGLPMVQVAPYPREIPMDVMSNRDDVGYPVQVGFFDKTNPVLDENMDRNLKWRRQVAAAFRAQQLAGVSESVLTTWTPDSISVVAGLQQNYHVGGLTLMFRSRESRGLIA